MPYTCTSNSSSVITPFSSRTPQTSPANLSIIPAPLSRSPSLNTCSTGRPRLWAATDRPRTARAVPNAGGIHIVLLHSFLNLPHAKAVARQGVWCFHGFPPAPRGPVARIFHMDTAKKSDGRTVSRINRSEWFSRYIFASKHCPKGCPAVCTGPLDRSSFSAPQGGGIHEYRFLFTAGSFAFRMESARFPEFTIVELSFVLVRSASI